MRSQPHDASHEAVLRAILVGEPSSSDRRSAAVVQNCARCRETLAELQWLARRLDAAGIEERAAIEEARVSGRERAAFVSHSMRRVVGFVRVTAAASLAFLLAWWAIATLRTSAPETLLGPRGKAVELVAPLDRFGPGEVFRYRLGTTDVERAWIDVRDGDGSTRISYEVHGGEWQPDASTVRRWSETVEWRVRCRLADGTLSVTRWQSLRRSR